MTGAALVVRSNAATESALAQYNAIIATFFDIVADRCGQREQRRADAFDGIGDKAGAEVREAAVLRPGLGTKLLPGRSAHDHAIYDAASQHPREEGCGRKEKLGSRRGHCVALVRLAVAESCSAMHPATTGRRLQSADRAIPAACRSPPIASCAMLQKPYRGSLGG